MAHETVLADGAFDFAGGVNSDAVTTVRSALVPHGLRPDQLAWLSNGSVRGGTISPRPGFRKLADLLATGLFQGGIMFEPIQDTSPYLILSVSGHIYSFTFSPPYTLVDLSVKFGQFNPATISQAFFAQGNGFVVIQAGDGVTLPLFYSTAEGEKLVRSRGLNGVLAGPNCQQLPPALAMVFYQGRMWYSSGRLYIAGDIEGNQNSGTLPWNFKDSILSVTENPLAIGGDAFLVPSSAGNIRALAYTANIDTTLGQGPLYIFTRKQVYSLQVPVTRADWIAANNNNQPLQTVSQINNGAVGEDGIVHVNGDLFYVGIDPAIRSFAVATRYYGQWGNVPISNNVNRALQFNDRSIMRRTPGIYADNRMLEGCLPSSTTLGVVFPVLLPLDFDIISTLGEREPPAWEGGWEGVDWLKLFSGDFGGLQRTFGLSRSRVDGSLDMFEISVAERTDSNDSGNVRIQWYAEFPAFTWQKEMELKQLRGGEIWVDRVFGTVDVLVEWRPDADPCWHFWFRDELCIAQNCAEDINCPIAYPPANTYGPGNKFPITLPEPPLPSCQTLNKRPCDIGYQHQVRVTIKGYCRIRGLILYAELKDRKLYDGLAC